MSSPYEMRFQLARGDPAQVVLEGFHALKHALRFGAEVIDIVSDERSAVLGLARRLAADLVPVLLARLEPVEAGIFARLAPVRPQTSVLALARRPASAADPLAAALPERPLVLLEEPRHPGNLGAVVRVAAAAEAGAVLSLGDADPWHPAAVRGGAGLQFALPTGRLEALPARLDRPLVALDPEGEAMTRLDLPDDAICAFGTERDGLSAGLLARADRRLRLPMRPGVSSLNLATAVAATLYAWRLKGG